MFKKKSKDLWAENELNKMKSLYTDAYDNMIYKSVEELYNALQPILKKQGHSGFSYSATIAILRRLLDRKPLSPITDEDFFEGQEDRTQKSPIYLEENKLKSDLQCPRYTALFRKEYLDGRVEYQDVDRCIGINQHDLDFYSGFYEKCCEDVIPPITMPYAPSNTPIKIYVWEFSYDPKAENKFYIDPCEYNAAYIEKVVMPNGDTVKVGRCYVDNELAELSKEDMKALKKVIEADRKAFREKCHELDEMEG